MSPWDHSPARDLIYLQRLAAIQKMGEQARELLAKGYAADADRVLDEMIERKRTWSQEQ